MEKFKYVLFHELRRIYSTARPGQTAPELIIANLLIWCICSVRHFRFKKCHEVELHFYEFQKDIILCVHWNQLRHKFLIYMRWANKPNLFDFFAPLTFIRLQSHLNRNDRKRKFSSNSLRSLIKNVMKFKI